jgi:hypothetical protein
MSNQRISELPSIDAIADDDILVVVDVSEPNIEQRTKRITFNELQEAIELEIESEQQVLLDAKAPLASPALTGAPTAPTPSAGDNSGRLATTEYVDTADALKAPLASPALTGNPTAPTQTSGSNNTRLANTAFVKDAVDTMGATKISSSEKGAASGVCPLGPDSLIPSSYLPSYVDDVLEYVNQAAFPVTGEIGKIYVDTSTNKQYRWGGSAYHQITSGAVDSVNGKTGVVTLTTTDIAESTNLYWTQARFDTAFSAKSTSDLAEGSNLYFTNARALTVINTLFNFGTPADNDFLTYDIGTTKWVSKSKSAVKTLLGIDLPSSAISALNIDWSAGKVFKKSISVDTTLTFSNATDGKEIKAILKNTDLTNPVVITFGVSTFRPATISINPDSAMVLSIVYDGSDYFVSKSDSLVLS